MEEGLAWSRQGLWSRGYKAGLQDVLPSSDFSESQSWWEGNLVHRKCESVKLPRTWAFSCFLTFETAGGAV